jgi:aldehyde dehydrogenase (NAD+)
VERALALGLRRPVIWKPIDKTPLVRRCRPSNRREVMQEMPEVPPGIAALHRRSPRVGEPWPPAKSSAHLRHRFGPHGPRGCRRRRRRLGRSCWNSAATTDDSRALADLELATRAIVFAAVGTCGQRCTTLRRLIVHESLKDEIVRRLTTIYDRLKIGDPRQEGVPRRPLIDKSAFDAMEHALSEAKKQGGKVHGGGRVTEGVPKGGAYCRPAIVEMPQQSPITCEETFAPILYVMTYKNFDQAIEIHNAVPQGLSSAVFTGNVREAELFLSPAGSDCGIANGQHRHQRRRDRRRLRWRKTDRRRPRIRLRLLENLHAPNHQHHQLLHRPPPRARRLLRRRFRPVEKASPLNVARAACPC